MGHDHALNGVGDKLPGYQGVTHPLVAHGDAVAHADNGKLHGDAPGFPHSVRGGPGYGVQVQVARHNFAFGNRNADQRPVEFFIDKPQRLEQGPVGSPGNALLDTIATHHNLLSVFFQSL